MSSPQSSTASSLASRRDSIFVKAATKSLHVYIAFPSTHSEGLSVRSVLPNDRRMKHSDLNPSTFATPPE
ncbi:hypothetical protein X963_4856 [Burkholderia pseudomallei MSHR7498]|nr:hypothetical protein X963_4856 [Burkholderia pseudomallei MSHR7498]